MWVSRNPVISYVHVCVPVRGYLCGGGYHCSILTFVYTSDVTSFCCLFLAFYAMNQAALFNCLN